MRALIALQSRLQFINAAPSVKLETLHQSSEATSGHDCVVVNHVIVLFIS